MPYLIPIVLVAIGMVYYKFNPELYDLMPKCPWWLLTGTYCPSCGIQRTIFQLLHGNWGTALRLNPFLTLSIPYAVLCILGKWYNYKHVFDRMNRFLYSRSVLITYVVAFFLWWILRNILGV